MPRRDDGSEGTGTGASRAYTATYLGWAAFFLSLAIVKVSSCVISQTQRRR